MSQTNSRPLKIGLYLPTAEGVMRHETPRWRDFQTMARLAEEVGFDSAWMPDHFLFRVEEDNTQGVWECWTMLAALAASTSRIHLGTLVTCTGFRNPALLAKMADTVDEISGGRLILGLGAGWHEPEYRAFGYPYDHRVSRFEEAIQIIHPLLRQGAVDFTGTYYQARDCVLQPRGPRPAGPPIMVGTLGPRMLRLTATYADLWNADWTRHPDELTPLLAIVDAACDEVGRDPATLGRTASVLIDLPSAAGRGGRSPRTRNRPPDHRSPEEIADLLRAYAAIGISHAMVWLDPFTPAGIEEFAPVLELLDQD